MSAEPDGVVDLDALLQAEGVQIEGPWPPTAAQIGAALSMLALVSPAALGGIPVLPVTIDQDRRRRADQIEQEAESSVGVHQDVSEASAALALSQRRLAKVTREVQGSFAHDVSEQDVVQAAHLVAEGQASEHQQRRFRSALGRVANDSVDLFILTSDEEGRRNADSTDEPEEDLEAWLAEFE